MNGQLRKNATKVMGVCRERSRGRCAWKKKKSRSRARDNDLACNLESSGKAHPTPSTCGRVYPE